MTTPVYRWRVYCTDESDYQYIIQENEPTVCPADSGNIDADQTVAFAEVSQNFQTDSYINFDSQLADNQAVFIQASNVAGGIDIDAGTGGITIDTTNAMLITSNAASRWRTLNVGNLDLDAKGVLNLEGQGGINIGANNDAQAINIGTSTSSRAISVGNQTGTTSTSISSVNGGFSLTSIAGNSDVTLTSDADNQELLIRMFGNTASSIHLCSEGNQVDAIKMSTLTSSGGMDIDIGTTGFDLDTTGPINLASSQAAGGSITLDGASGGLTLSAGVYGVAVNASGTGVVGIGHWGGGDIQLGTAATSRTITIGNRTSSTSLIQRHADTGFKSITQGDHTIYSNTDQTVTIEELKTRILTMTPTTDRTITLPTSDLAVAGLSGISANDAIEFFVINESTHSSDPSVIVAMGTGGTLVGNGEVAVRENNANTWKTSGSGGFLMRFTSVGDSGNAYTVYRMP